MNGNRTNVSVCGTAGYTRMSINQEYTQSRITLIYRPLIKDFVRIANECALEGALTDLTCSLKHIVQENLVMAQHNKLGGID